MWQRPQLLNAMADLLFAAGSAMLLAAAVLWIMRQPFAPVRDIRLAAPLRHVALSELEEAAQGALRGNFLSVSLEDVRAALETVPWVRKATVRRVWPNRLDVALEEHRPVARWGVSGNEWVNTFGEVFAAQLTVGAKPALPRFSGPPGMAPALLRHYGASVAAFAPMGVKPARLALSPRHALEMTLDTGLVLKLGRERQSAPIQQRLARFIQAYPASVAERNPRPAVADLRYPNGFTLYPQGVARPAQGD
ncbi:MAG: cell division protein FtsQ/DivIB [Zoogloeaceae bacterium]|jgi:cell division protein FtsQ|nr:cell division protein FtsQ/DivIB [Zoogloeaceae bacterium]